MNTSLKLSILAVLFSCNNYIKEKSDPRPQELDKLSIKGKLYNGIEFETKLNKIINNSVLDTLTKNHLFDRIEFFKEKYNPSSDEFGLTQMPSNFLFLDLNDDKYEDIIFQSNGPFITDSHMFFIFLSNKKDKYKIVRQPGQIIDIHFVEEFCCSTDSKKEKYLKVDYFNYGCCDNPWDQYITGILNLNSGPFGDELYTISLSAINRTAVRDAKKEKK